MPRTETRGTAIGITAILMWATLALFTALCERIPPFQLTAMSFLVATLIGLLWLWRSGLPFSEVWKHPPSAWLHGVCGLFGYHLFYFTALKHAPVVEASLIAYLWPLLIVLMATRLPGEGRLKPAHGIGALMGLGGAVLLVTGGRSVDFDPAHATGYLLAILCALTWSGYSVLSRRFAKVPTSAVIGFCGVTTLLSGMVHLGTEVTVIPTPTEWFGILGLGLGPVGGAFFTWDIGVKTGNLPLLGIFSYGAPLLSTLLLVLFGMTPFTPDLAISCLLIAGGSFLAAVFGRNPA